MSAEKLSKFCLGKLDACTYETLLTNSDHIAIAIADSNALASY